MFKTTTLDKFTVVTFNIWKFKSFWDIAHLKLQFLWQVIQYSMYKIDKNGML